MANLVITSTAYTVKVVFNDYSEATNIKSTNFRREDIAEVVEHHNADYITILMLDGNDFNISWTSHVHAMVVDSIDGVAPTSNDDLTAKLEALQQV
jgi:hypothetical protein